MPSQSNVRVFAPRHDSVPDFEQQRNRDAVGDKI